MKNNIKIIIKEQGKNPVFLCYKGDMLLIQVKHKLTNYFNDKKNKKLETNEISEM